MSQLLPSGLPEASAVAIAAGLSVALFRLGRELGSTLRASIENFITLLFTAPLAMLRRLFSELVGSIPNPIRDAGRDIWDEVTDLLPF